MGGMRLQKISKELNISVDRAVEYLNEKGFDIEKKPTLKLSEEQCNILFDEFQKDRHVKEVSEEVKEEQRRKMEAIRKEQEEARLEKERQEKEKAEKKKKEEEEIIKGKAEKKKLKIIGKVDIGKKEKTVSEEEVKEEKTETGKTTTPEETIETIEAKTPEKVAETEKPDEETEETGKPQEPEMIKTQYQKLSGLKKTGQVVDISKFEKDKSSKSNEDKKDKKKRKRKSRKTSVHRAEPGSNIKPKKTGRAKKKIIKEEPSEEEVKKQIKETLERLQGKKTKASKYRRQKRSQRREITEQELEKKEAESKIIRVVEFASVSELATMMNKPVTDLISTCMSLGIMVTVNQRLDADTMSLLVEEFGYTLEFVDAELEISPKKIDDKEEDLKPRPPIVTVMGHVDHGKTSLLDYIRKTNVIAGEAGGITQHIAAYEVEMESGNKVTFLDTPGHAAFTAMRARGAKVTDIAVIVISAADRVMPQTKEAISHAQAAGVPIIFAINKIDLPNANPDKIKEELSQMNLLVEDWGGKYQSQEISAKTGEGVQELLEKILLEAEIMKLKANPDKPAEGAVLEASLDKGRGYVATFLVEGGTLRKGDYVLAGHYHGKIRAMFNERGKQVKEAGPSTPVLVLGLDGPPQAGDTFQVFEDEREAKQIAIKKTQLLREQALRTQKHITLDEIGRRIALGNFKELNLIIKGDVDGSIEALAGALQKMETDEVQINILHKGVGAITDSDVHLAQASDAIIIGFNVRPIKSAQMLADQENIDIRFYSIIYDAINDIKDAIEGMLSPEEKEEITGTAEIREVYKISKVGNVGGCMVTDGKIYSKSKVRILRENIVIHSGELATLKRFKDDVKEVAKGYECGMQIKNYNDIQVGDVIEGYRVVEVKKQL